MAVRKIMAGAVRTGDRVADGNGRLRVVVQAGRDSEGLVLLDLAGGARLLAPAVTLLTVERSSRVEDHDALARAVVHRSESKRHRKSA
jgi:hypothetical protein